MYKKNPKVPNESNGCFLNNSQNHISRHIYYIYVCESSWTRLLIKTEQKNMLMIVFRNYKHIEATTTAMKTKLIFCMQFVFKMFLIKICRFISSRPAHLSSLILFHSLIFPNMPTIQTPPLHLVTVYAYVYVCRDIVSNDNLFCVLVEL